MFQNQTVSLQQRLIPPFLLSLRLSVRNQHCVPSNSTLASKRHLRCFRPPNRATCGAWLTPSAAASTTTYCSPPSPKRMADSTVIVPYHDPFDDHLRTIENILMCDESPTLDLADFPYLPDQNASPSSSFPFLQSGNDDQIADPNDPFSDPFVWSLCKREHIFDTSQADGPSEPCDERNGDCDGEEDMGFQSSNVGNPIHFSVQPPPNAPYMCSCCQVLREITHTNGNDVTKLEIHGRLGMICHAVYEKYSIESSNNQKPEYQMFDFCTESIGNVKHFLVKYCEERKRSGYVMLQDPLLIFYEALCVGLDWDDSIDTDDFIQTSPTNSGEIQMSQTEPMKQTEVESNGMSATRSTLSAQRERTGKLTLKDFIKYFHFPIETAAKKVRICPTVMKKICRKHGMTRWPHRKIKSIERKISRRAKSLTSNDVGERAQAQVDIERLQQEIANIYTRFGG